MSILTYPLDHIGIAVTDLNQSISDYQKNFNYTLQLREKIPSQQVEVAFLGSDSASESVLIELLATLDSGSTLQKFLKTRGPGLHHLCYRVKDIHAELVRLDHLGHTLIDKVPRPGAHNSLIAFIHPKSMGGVLTELCQRK